MGSSAQLGLLVLLQCVCVGMYVYAFVIVYMYIGYMYKTKEKKMKTKRRKGYLFKIRGKDIILVLFSLLGGAQIRKYRCSAQEFIARDNLTEGHQYRLIDFKGRGNH